MNDYERPPGRGADCGAEVLIRRDGRLMVATCTAHGCWSHHDPLLNLTWPIGDGPLVAEEETR